MALGGGTFIAGVQNKVLPGTYINFVGAAKTTDVFGDRGIAAIALKLGWGAEQALVKVTAEDFQAKALQLFGLAYGDDELKGMRDLFKNARVVYVYRLNPTGTAAENTYAVAKHTGVGGNKITIKIEANPDVEDGFIVTTLFNTTVVDVQKVTDSEQLVANEFVTFKEFTPDLTSTIVAALTGGVNGVVVESTAHAAFLAALESKYVNAVCCYSNTTAVKELYVAFAKRMRDEVGSKLQVVVYNTPADYEGVVNLKNSVVDSDNEYDALYWVTGAIAGCEINKSNTNRMYDGEFAIDVNHTQAELESYIKSGFFAFHQVGDDVRVLEDINSLTTLTDTKNEDFKANQTIRVIDQIATDIAAIFNTRFLGRIPNDASGRIDLWNEIVTHHKNLQGVGAIENFRAEDVTVEAGETKRAVVISDVVTPVNAMEQLYMTVLVQ